MHKKIFACATVLFLLTGCGGPSQGSMSDGAYYAAEEREDAYAGSAMNTAMADEDYSVVQEEKAEKLVYTGSISMETKDYDNYTKEFVGILKKYEGITQSMNEYTRYDNRFVDMTVRIPAAKFDDFLNEIRNSSGSVTSLSTNVDNITKRYNDNDLQIEALETQHARLIELLAKAEDLSDVVLLEERLSDVEYQLNSLKSYKGDMDEQVAYSTITVTISEVNVLTKTSFGQRVKEAFGDSWANFIAWLQDFVIGVIYALPAIILLAVLIVILRGPVRKWVFRRRERRKAAQLPKGD